MQQDEILTKLTNLENLIKKGQTEKPLTFNEAVQYLDISKSYLYKLTCKNKIPHYKPQGKKIYFDKSELDAWLLMNPVKTETEVEQEADNYIVNRKRGSE